MIKFAHQSLFTIAMLLCVFSIDASAERGVTSDKILIGQSISVSGQAAERAAEIKRASDIVFAKINSSGGIHGRIIEVITYDDGYIAERTFLNAKKLIEKDKVFALFEFFGTPNSKAVIPLAQGSETPFLFPTSGAQGLFNPPQKYIFTLRQSYIEEAEPIVDFLVKKRGIKKIAVAYQDDAAGHETRTGTQKALAKHGLSLAGQAGFNAKTEKVDKVFEELKKTKAEAVILGMIVKPASDFAKLAKAQKMKWIFGGPTTLATDLWVQLAGEASEGSVVSASLPYLGRALEIVKQFNEDQKKTGITGAANIEGYFNALVLVEALKRAGRDLTRAKLVEALESMKDFDLGGVGFTFSPDRRAGSKKVFLSEVKGGAFTPVDL